MANISKFSIKDTHYEYELSLGWDIEAFLSGNVSFDIDVARRSLENVDEEITLHATVSIELRDKQPMLIIEAQGNEIVSYPLREIFDESQIIDMIPGWVFGGGEPITGCLLRAGLSASITQIIACKKQTAGIDWFWERMKEIGRCLINALPDIAASAARKAITCIIKFGF